MRRIPVLRTIRMKLPGPSELCLVLLASCFLLGGLVALVCAKRCGAETISLLSGFLREYCSGYDPESVLFSIGHLVVLYFGSIILAFLFGFSSFGCVLIPLLSGVLGFSFFFSASCFVRALGTDGILAAAALFSVRLLFTLPCFFAVAGFSMRFSTRLAAILFGKPESTERIYYPKKYFLIFVLSLVWLCVGVFCERIVTPQLFCESIKGFV